MENQYVGDIGDYGKYSLLRAFSDAGIKIGVNWYLVPDETQNQDGRYTQYLNDETFGQCDAYLLGNPHGYAGGVPAPYECQHR